MSANEADSAEARVSVPPVRGFRALAVAAVVGLFVVLGVLLVRSLLPSDPDDDSAEAGFARDMSVHHAQAVEMALIVRDRTENDQIRTFATDIMLTQQNEIGRMESWLDVWDLPQTGEDGPMAWMGHEVSGRMPGMASPEDISRLRELPPAEMDKLFLQLMITHHEAGAVMAEAVLDRTDNDVVEDLASIIVRTQRAEITLMQSMLDQIGIPETPDAPAATPSPTHDEHESTPAAAL